MTSKQEGQRYGIVGFPAPELEVPIWFDEKGQTSDPMYLSEFADQIRVLYCFQAWCPGCHSRGLPDLKQMVDAMKEDHQVLFLAIQTVFEGHAENTVDRVQEIQREYHLSIPFGHDAGNENTSNIASTMINYRTGGTPWFIFINKEGIVVFNDFHLNVDKAIEYLRENG